MSEGTERNDMVEVILLPKLPEDSTLSASSKFEVVVVEEELVSSKRNDTKITCHLCGFFLNKKRYLKSHITEVHEKQRPYKCGQCNVGYFVGFTL